MRTTFGSAYERLVALKDEYDPTNVFSRNQNVPPSETARAGGGEGHETTPTPRQSRRRSRRSRSYW